MSSFVVDQESINKIVSYLYFIVAGDSPMRGPVDRALKSIDINILSDSADLAAKMYDLNVSAFLARYPDKTYTPFEFIHKTRLHVTDIPAYKLLECWLYQCTEGDIDQTLTYQAMDKILRIIGANIISSLPEYQAAYWG